MRIEKAFIPRAPEREPERPSRLRLEHILEEGDGTLVPRLPQ
jgi:hypothetical protein